jgi:rRNA maturation endonuclease Nob1
VTPKKNMFCFGVLTRRPLVGDERVEHLWACHVCQRITGAGPDRVCRRCGHRRCKAPDLKIYETRREATDGR